MTEPRFRRMRGQMLVVAPDGESEWRQVDLLYDTVNDALGVLLVGESVLRGYCFFVPQDAFKSARDRGAKTDVLKV